jgi:hypothetical protein
MHVVLSPLKPRSFLLDAGTLGDVEYFASDFLTFA